MSRSIAGTWLNKVSKQWASHIICGEIKEYGTS